MVDFSAHRSNLAYFSQRVILGCVVTMQWLRCISGCNKMCSKSIHRNSYVVNPIKHSPQNRCFGKSSTSGYFLLYFVKCNIIALVTNDHATKPLNSAVNAQIRPSNMISQGIDWFVCDCWVTKQWVNSVWQLQPSHPSAGQTEDLSRHRNPHMQYTSQVKLTISFRSKITKTTRRKVQRCTLTILNMSQMSVKFDDFHIIYRLK